MKDLFQPFVESLYQGLFQRGPDEKGLHHFVSLLEGGMGALEVFQLLANSEEARNVWKQSNPPTLSNEQIARYMKSIGHDHITVVDIGAQKLEYESHVYEPLREYELSGPIIGFEPLTDRADKRNRVEKDVIIHPIAIGTGQPEHFHINSFDATSSMFPWNVELIMKYQGLCEFFTKEKTIIETKKLDEIPLPNQIGLLKIDVQGYELRILENALEMLKKTSVVFTEVEFQPIYLGQPLFSTVDEFMRRHDFQLIDVLNQVRMTPKTMLHPLSENGVQLMWGDALYLKKTELCSRSMLLDQIAISAVVFGKNPYATYLAEEFERMFSEEIKKEIMST